MNVNVHQHNKRKKNNTPILFCVNIHPLLSWRKHHFLHNLYLSVASLQTRATTLHFSFYEAKCHQRNTIAPSLQHGIAAMSLLWWFLHHRTIFQQNGFLSESLNPPSFVLIFCPHLPNNCWVNSVDQKVHCGCHDHGWLGEVPLNFLAIGTWYINIFFLHPHKF